MSKSQTFTLCCSSILMFRNEISLWTMRFSAITLMAEKACCQIENIVDKESNEEVASSKDERIQAVTISLCSLSSQFCSNLASGRLGSYSVAFRSSWPETADPVCWVKSGFILLAVL